MKVTETFVNAKTGETRTVERELTEQEITEMEQRQLEFGLNNELNEIDQWFAWYDNQIAQYNRCQRLGLEFDRDIAELDAEAVKNQLRIREVNEQLKQFETKS